jgi:hypothetical protein
MRARVVAKRAMTIRRRYRLGVDFPSEGFVQAAIERHFSDLGFAIDVDGHADLFCTHPDRSECWLIEAKGKTSDPGLDFKTCLGQLVQRMRERDTRYGIALPDLPPYEKQIGQLSAWVVETLRIHWLMVSPNGTVRITPPNQAEPRDD